MVIRICDDGQNDTKGSDNGSDVDEEKDSIEYQTKSLPFTSNAIFSVFFGDPSFVGFDEIDQFA